jgi:hypothetical protein
MVTSLVQKYAFSFLVVYEGKSMKRCERMQEFEQNVLVGLKMENEAEGRQADRKRERDSFAAESLVITKTKIDSLRSTVRYASPGSL